MDDVSYSKLDLWPLLETPHLATNCSIGRGVARVPLVSWNPPLGKSWLPYAALSAWTNQLSQLVSNDRNEEAVRVLTIYHGDGDRKSPFVLLSYKEMLEEIVLSGSDKRWWDYSELFNSTDARWRMVCVAGMAFFGQVCLPIPPIPSQ